MVPFYGGLLTALSLGTAFGPLAAAAVYGSTGSYEPFLWVTVLSMAGSALALASLPRTGFQPQREQAPETALEGVVREETACGPGWGGRDGKRLASAAGDQHRILRQ
jgi:hypothetical protein